MANSLLCFIPKVWYHWILVPKIQILTYLSLIWTENGVLELRKVTQISNIYIYQNFWRQILGLLKSLFIQSLFKMKGFVTFHGSCLSVHTQKCSKALKKQIREIVVFFQSFLHSCQSPRFLLLWKQLRAKSKIVDFISLKSIKSIAF